MLEQALTTDHGDLPSDEGSIEAMGVLDHEGHFYPCIYTEGDSSVRVDLLSPGCRTIPGERVVITWQGASGLNRREGFVSSLVGSPFVSLEISPCGPVSVTGGDRPPVFIPGGAGCVISTPEGVVEGEVIYIRRGPFFMRGPGQVLHQAAPR